MNPEAVGRGVYSAQVRELFARPQHGGDLPDGRAPDGRGVAEEGRAGMRVELTAITENDRAVALRYRVFGCPHLIAACETVCERLEGGPVEALADLNVGELVATLDIPVEKTGRLLLLEDAMCSLYGDLKGRDSREIGT